MGVMGLNGRGIVLARQLARMPTVELAYLCDVDATVLGKGVAETGALQPRTAGGVADLRRMLDDKDVDAVVIATPDHWHAPATILALSAGKHVYLEKPAGHNPREGELLAQAQRKHGHLVQLGTQRRSGPRLIEAVAAIREGAIGTSRGAAILGTTGSMILDQNGYAIHDPKGKLVREATALSGADALNTSADDGLTTRHLTNFVDAVRTGTKLTAPIEDGVRTNLLCHLGNIAQRTGRKLRTDPASGRILDDAGAMKLWERAYEPGWAPAV